MEYSWLLPVLLIVGAIAVAEAFRNNRSPQEYFHSEVTRDYEEERKVAQEIRIRMAVKIIRHCTGSLSIGETTEVEVPLTTADKKIIDEFIEGVREEISQSGDLLCVGHETFPLPSCVFSIKRMKDISDFIRKG